jgi:hypothetical protein
VAVIALGLPGLRPTPVHGAALDGINTEEMRTLGQNWQALRQRHLRLLPVPKRLTFTSAPIVIAGAGARETVIVLARKGGRGQLAADEIVSRVQELAPQVSLPVLSTPRPGAFNIVIENQWPNAFTRNPQAPPGAKLGDQTYRITPAPDGLVLRGWGEQGMLYAAVTLRWLIEREGDRVLLHPAGVLDWPDFADRYVSSAAIYMKKYADEPQKHLAYMKHVVDFYFRLKATALPLHTLSTYRMFSPFIDKPAFNANVLEAAKLVNDYALERGLTSFYTQTASLGLDSRDKDNPAVKEMTYDDSHGSYYSWARLDLHQKQAEQMAGFCRQTNTGGMYLHAPDGGGVQNPEYWNDRDRLTREKYGDDRAQADADMFGEYVKAFRKVDVRPLLVVYPYNGETVVVDSVLRSLGMADSPQQRAEAAALAKRITDWMAALNSRLPLDVPVCVREGPRLEMLSFYHGFPGRPMFIYYEVSHPLRSAQPLLCPEVATLATAYDPARREHDILWGNVYPVDFREATVVAALEYSWNTAFPGARSLSRGEEVFGWDRESLAVAAERAAVGLYGDEAGQYLKELYDANLSFFAAVNPRKATEQRNFRDYVRLSEVTVTAADSAVHKMNALWAHLKQTGQDGRRSMGEFSYPHFVQMYGMTAAARVYAAVNLHLERAEAAIRQGNLDQGIREIAAARQALQERRGEYERTLAAIAGEPNLVLGMEPDYYRRWTQASDDWLLTRPDFAALSARVDAFSAKKEALFQESNVPGWFSAAMSGGSLTALRSADRLTVDGALGESVWKSAPPIEHFVAWKLMKHCPVGAAARLAYDSDCLYLGFEARQPLVGAIHEAKRGNRDYALTEQVELFLQPPGGQCPVFQIVVDTAGNVFTSKPGAAAEETGADLGIRAASSRTATGWAAEVAVPFASLNAGPGANWRAMVAYDCLTATEPRQVEYFSCVFFDGKQFRTADLYPELAFAAEAQPPPTSAPGIAIEKAAMQVREHTTGAGSAISFVPRLESRRPLYDVSLVARLEDARKKTVWEQAIHAAPFTPLLWTPSSPVQVQLGTVFPALRLTVTVRYSTLDSGPQTGQATTLLGDPSKMLSAADLYAPGPPPGSFGLAAPCWFDVATPPGACFSFARGTVEFWLKPQWSPRSETDDAHVLFHCGMLRPEAPRADNRNSLVLYHEPKYGNLYLALANDAFDRRQTYANIDSWKPGEWHHLACVWDVATEGGARMDLYCDGAVISGKNGLLDKGFNKPANPLLPVLSAVFPAEVGAMNSGEQPAQAVICDLKLSPEVLYTDRFTPPQPPDELRRDGMLFRFDKSLTGNYRLRGGAGEITATAGSLMKRG